MRVLGIDCGSEFTGYGIVERRPDDSLQAISYGAIKLKTRDALPWRLLQVWDELRGQIEAHAPQMVAVEGVFFAHNVKSALKLGQVRGVALLVAASCGLEVAEYAPLAIKSAVVGYGQAEKAQVQQMVTRLLRLPEIPQPPDAADALAIAICHLNTSSTLARQTATI